LAKELLPTGREVIRASIDGFHRPRAERYRQGADSPEGYYRDSFDHGAIRRELLDPLGPGGNCTYRAATFDFRTDSDVALLPSRAAADAILLFDGVFLLRPELRDGWDLAIVVTVEPDESLRRALVRDVELFGSLEEVELRYRTRYLPGQQLYVDEASPLAAADFVVVNDRPAAPLLGR
jgi:uridine kinase